MKFEKTPMEEYAPKHNIKNNLPEIENATMQYINLMHESDMARMSRTNELLMKVNKRLHTHIMAQLLIIFAMIIAFLIYESQYEDVSKITEEYTASVDGNGVAFNNGSGEVNYGGTSDIQENNDNLS